MNVNERLVCPSLSIHTTSRCTLKCAKCGWAFPFFKNHAVADVDTTMQSLEKIFEIYDEVKELRFGGAEAFLHPDIERMMEKVSQYKSRFEYGIVVTNGTYIPRKSVIETIRSLPYRLIVRVDHYGELSKKYDELISVLTENGIEVDERRYDAHDQAFGGWIDLGDYTDKRYTSDQVKDVFKRCRIPKDCTILYNNYITICSYSFSGKLMGILPEKEGEKIYLDGDQSVGELKGQVRSWGQKPLDACRLCNGCDPKNSPRVVAAEQIGGEVP